MAPRIKSSAQYLNIELGKWLVFIRLDCAQLSNNIVEEKHIQSHLSQFS